ncbi:hypothetical protein AMELA_G00052880 [Ameiurus melas]|uniref:Uncharacterized protein n=1 Tax=Ameiurus melas TaxID=219545 RepID=A0A7J6B8U7_AMEME|nr:hypothetical protein AMELA_G00052880 [Ameiurus melas]
MSVHALKITGVLIRNTCEKPSASTGPRLWKTRVAEHYLFRLDHLPVYDHVSEKPAYLNITCFHPTICVITSTLLRFSICSRLHLWIPLTSCITV